MFATATPPDDQPPRLRGRFQFRLGTLFLLMLLVSVVTAALAGMLRQGNADMPWEFYLVMLVTAPLGVTIVLSLIYAAARWLRHARRREP